MARKPASAGHMKKGPTPLTAKARIARPSSPVSGGKVSPVRKALEKAYGKHTKR